MGRERQTGDWAAWMGSGAPSVPARDPAPAKGPMVRDAESLASPVEAVAGPAAAPAEADARPVGIAGLPTQPDPDTRTSSVGVADVTGDAHRSPRREATRQRILDAAREEFAERGVIGGSVEDICERAGFTRGAFYSNFTDKDDVLDALVEREHTRLLEHLDATFVEVDREMEEADSLEAVLAGMVDRILRSIPVDRQLSLIQTELEIFAIRRPDHARRFLETNNRFRERIGSLIDEAMRRYGRELLVDPSVITDAIVAIADRSVRRALLAGGDADPDAMASEVLPGLLLALSRPVEA
jgi:AcrR family transcriptional regulator